MGTAIKRPVPDWVKQSFVMFDIRAVVKFSRNGVPPPEIAVPPPKVVVPPPGNDVLSPFGRKSLKLLPPEVRF